MILGSPAATTRSCGRCRRSSTIDFGMNVQQAIEAPRWSTRSFPASPFPHTMHPGDLSVEDRIPVAVQKALIAKGHKLTVSGRGRSARTRRLWTSSEVLSAGADVRNDAYAWAR